MTDYKVWDATVTFRADKGGDAIGTMLIRLRWDDPPAEIAEALVQLWRAHHAAVIAQAQTTGTTLDMT